MSDVSQTLALLVLEQVYRGDLVAQINRRSALLRLLKIVEGAGQNVAWAGRGDGQLAENYAEGADASNFGSDEQDPAILQWGHYRSNFHVTGTARRTAATSTTPNAVRNLIGLNFLSASEKLVSLINQSLYTGAGTGTTIAGLDVAVADDTNTYATIDRSSKSFWRPYVIDPGALTALSVAQIRKDIGAIYDQCGENPDIAVCSTAVFNTVAGLYDNTRRYVQDVVTARGAVRLDAGYQAIEVDGCYFVKDKDATANRIYYLNSRHVTIEYLPLDVGLMSALMEMGTTMEANDGYGNFPLGIWVEKLAKNGDSDRYQCLTQLQLKVARPNACGARLNVATAS